MMIKIFDATSFNDNFFMSYVAEKGTVLAFEKRSNDTLFPTVSAKIWDGSGSPIGVLLSDVVNKDLTRVPLNSYNETQIGGKVRLMTQGKLLFKFGKGLRLPLGQPIYVDPKTGKLTWKALSVQVGKLRRPQDADGFCLIEVNF